MGFVSPEEFILLAEQTGQIRNLTRFILTRIAHDLAVLHREGLKIGAAVNLSALDLSNTQLPEDIRQAFGDQDIDFQWLTFEVTESAIMTDTESAGHTLDQLRAMGASLSVDDFGAEYRHKPDNLGFATENDWWDAFVAWVPDRRVSVTAAWTDLGDIAGLEDQRGLYLSLQGSF